MQTNLWNIKSSKERLDIREKTQAHKRHLINVVKAKSSLNTRNKQWKIKSLNQSFKKRVGEDIRKSNRELVERISQMDRLSYSQSNIHSSRSKEMRKFTAITHNLRSMASLNRYNRSRKIENENAKFFNRLIHTNPTLSRHDWGKSSKKNLEYKQNMSRTKYTQPDYSFEASRNIKAKKPTYNHLKFSREALPHLSDRLEKIR